MVKMKLGTKLSLILIGLLMIGGVIAGTVRYNIDVDLDDKEDEYIREQAILNSRTPETEITDTAEQAIENKRLEEIFTNWYKASSICEMTEPCMVAITAQINKDYFEPMLLN